MYTQALQRQEDAYSIALASGIFTSAPWLTAYLNVLVLISWLLLIPPRPSSPSSSLSSPSPSPLPSSSSAFRWSRWVAFGVIVSTSLWSLNYCRSIGIVGSIGVGLNAALCTVMAANLMLLHDVRTFKRLRLRPRPRTGGGHCENHQSELELELEWEPMPVGLWHRVCWVLDLLTSLRGVHWSGSLFRYRPKGAIEAAAALPVKPIQQPIRRTSSLLRNFIRFMLDYLLIDLVKCIMITDPYFLGNPTGGAGAPLVYLSPWLHSPSAAVYTYRWLLGLAGVYLAIDLVYSFAILLQVNILGADVIGLNASPSAFPPVWGSVRAVFAHGLRGFWGKTWHQMLRMHFLSIADAIAVWLLVATGHPLEKKEDKRTIPGHRHRTSQAAVAFSLAVAFVLSGVFHACGSYTFLGPTRPLHSFLFFVLQPVGVAVQSLASHFIAGGSRPFLSRGYLELQLHRTANFVFAIGWLWCWGWLALDDYSSGGIWLLEPVPVSLIRGMGWSKEDVRWWCW